MIGRLFKSLRLLGAFGAILLLALAISVALMINVNTYADNIAYVVDLSYEHSDYQFVQSDLLNIEYAARGYLITGDQSYLEDYDFFQGDLDEILPDFGDYYTSLGDESTLSDLRDEVTANAETIIGMAEGGEIDFDTLAELSAREAEINLELAGRVFDMRDLIDKALIDLSDARFYHVLGGVLGFSLFPLLALWAFITASRFAAPLLDMATAVAAIGGRRYRDDMLAAARRSRGGVGELAAAIDMLAEAASARRAALQAEATRVQEELFTLQRSKLDMVDSVGMEGK